MNVDTALAPPNFDPISTEEAYLTFRLDCQSRRVRPRTLEWYAWMLPPFFAWLQAEHSIDKLEQVTSRHIRLYMVEKQTVDRGRPTERSASLHYSHNVARCLRSFFNFCVRDELLPKSPMQNVVLPKKPKKKLAAYTAKEIKQLIAACEGRREKSLLYLLLDTGVRASECIGLNVEDIDIDNQSAYIRDGKGGKPRTVYFGPTTARFLLKHLRDLRKGYKKIPLWIGELRGKRLTYSGLAQLLRRIGTRANIECTAHKFRRTFAINSLRNGMNIYVLASIMGHEDIDILKPYLDVLELDAKQSQQRYSVVENL